MGMQAIQLKDNHLGLESRANRLAKRLDIELSLEADRFLFCADFFLRNIDLNIITTEPIAYFPHAEQKAGQTGQGASTFECNPDLTNFF